MFDIKTVGVEAIPEIQNIARQTWPVAYGHILSIDQLDYMLNMMYSTEVLQKNIENNGTFAIAYDNHHNALAFAGFEPVFNAEVPTYKLQKLYALPNAHQKGLGRTLLQYVINHAKKNNAEKLTLTVNRFNNAFKFYLKMGFHLSERVDFNVGNGYYMNDYSLEKKL